MEKSLSQNETIQMLCKNRKQQNFQFLKEWDMQRARRLMVHRKMIDQLDESIQNKLGESGAYIDVVRQFLTDLLTQKIKYELQVVNNPESKIKNNLAGKGIYKHSAKELGRLYHVNNNYKGYKKLKIILENGLEKVEALLVESQKQILETKTRIELTINQIQDSNDLTRELCNQIVSIHKEQKSLKPYQCERDVYLEEQHFVYQTYLQTEVQRELGCEIIRYLEYVEQLEKQKLVVIKEVIGSYLEGIKEEHQNEGQLNLLQDILKKQTENKYIQECYSSDDLFTKAIIAELQAMQGLQPGQINMKYIKAFLMKLDYTYFGSINYLVLKEYHIFVKLGNEEKERDEEDDKEDKEDGQLESIAIVITVDGFLNFYFKERQIEISGNSQELLLGSVDYSAKIDNCLAMETKGDISLEIESKKDVRSAGVLQLQRGIRLVFANEDQREEFIEFIARILS